MLGNSQMATHNKFLEAPAMATRARTNLNCNLTRAGRGQPPCAVSAHWGPLSKEGAKLHHPRTFLSKKCNVSHMRILKASRLFLKSMLFRSLGVPGCTELLDLSWRCGRIKTGISRRSCTERANSQCTSLRAVHRICARAGQGMRISLDRSLASCRIRSSQKWTVREGPHSCYLIASYVQGL